jgi:hypothetical protein
MVTSKTLVVASVLLYKPEGQEQNVQATKINEK